MGAFEDFVNANLGLRKPLIQDNVPPLKALWPQVNQDHTF